LAVRKLPLTKDTRATIISLQAPHRQWHTWLGEPTMADAIMDRIVHGS
jgi:DNA replication protein DnaC